MRCTLRTAKFSAVWGWISVQYKRIPVLLAAAPLTNSVLAQSGEDDVIFSDSSDYAANIEFAEAVAPKEPRAAATQEMTLVDTPNAKTIAELVEQFNLPIEKP